MKQDQSNIESSFSPHKNGTEGAALAEVKEGPSELQIKSEVLCQLTPNRLFQVFVLLRMGFLPGTLKSGA